jgi:hypothetical protein
MKFCFVDLSKTTTVCTSKVHLFPQHTLPHKGPGVYILLLRVTLSISWLNQNSLRQQKHKIIKA